MGGGEFMVSLWAVGLAVTLVLGLMAGADGPDGW